MRALFVLLLCSCALFSPRRHEHDRVVVRRSFYVMGTICEIVVISKDKNTAEAAIQTGLNTLQKIDTLMSDYQDSSEISTLSREGSQRSVSLSPETITALQLSAHFSELSEGAFDITIGPLVDLWRDAHKQQKFPSAQEIEASKKRVNFQAIVLDETNRSATLSMPSMRLDLGGIAKGLAEDLAADEMSKSGAIGGRINMGGQVLVFGDEVPDEVSRVAVVDPRSPKKILFTISLHNESISTTADYERGKEINGQKVSHVIDPRTGSPAHGMLAAIVVHPKGVSADALSTILFLLGKENGTPLIESQDGLFWLMTQDETIVVSPSLQTRLKQ